MLGPVRIGILLVISSALLGCSHGRLCQDPWDPCADMGYSSMGYGSNCGCEDDHGGLCGLFKKRNKHRGHRWDACGCPCGSDPILNHADCMPHCGPAMDCGGCNGCGTSSCGGHGMTHPGQHVMSSGCSSCGTASGQGFPMDSGSAPYPTPAPAPAPTPIEEDLSVPEPNPTSSMMAPMMAPGSTWVPAGHQQALTPRSVTPPVGQPVYYPPVLH